MGLKIMIKQLLLIPIVVLFISVSALAETEEECIVGGGEWILPQNIDPREGDQRLPSCQCEQGYTWNGTTCTQISVEVLCESSDGVWADGSCQCPVQSSGWNDQVGCDYAADIESDGGAVADSKSKTGYMAIILLLIMLFAVLIYFLTRKKKQQQGDFYEK